MAPSSETVSRFATCCLALGLPVRGRRRPADLGSARSGFASLVRVAHDACDGWVGLAAAGDLSLPVLESIVANSTNSGELAREVGLSPEALGFRYESGLYLQLRAAEPAGFRLALAAATAAQGDLGKAHEIAAAVLQEQPGRFDARWLTAAICYHAARWPDVVALLTPTVAENNANAENPAKDLDPTSKHAARIALGIALARLGMHSPALSHLDEPQGPIAAAAADGALARALCLRALDDEDGALEALHELYASDPGNAQAEQALGDASFGLPTTTAARINARTDPWDPETEPDEHEHIDPAAAERKAALLDIAEQELDQFIGLDEVKDQVARLKSSVAMALRRQERGLAVGQRAHHLVFAGPPGTGKTTIARVVAKMYCGLGLLKKETIREVHRPDLVGQHIGETEAKTNAVIDSALDGVLFLDEAYSLVSTGAKNDFGLVAIDTLLARMENDRDRLVVIIAGYRAELDLFLSANEGLRSRFTRSIAFPSYTPDELVEIAVRLAHSRDSLFDDEAQVELAGVLGRLANSTTPDHNGTPRPSIDIAGNGRFVRNLVERSEEEREHRLDHTDNVDDFTDEQLMTITVEDVRNAEAILLRGLGLSEKT
ncbi:AAA ATPase central domain protein [Segniliparus rotundus DSM 44985]|uniref:AAA ATPase central domain protein n=1 Tax=Segniliparus rotundus (strain ATCC BAA-972 / CDC 1076 / CIP 108378 / DSM 44985 / JCM 13578) TaxID=640132 RepID=D6ZDF2_SEGRD|nr:type VII secretion AAA-ATPase EccA [Segniliparus rotundus]ADG97216.1 AAA ATPase central domain protein [Segniliparus rotundus DSM 44985]